MARRSKNSGAVQWFRNYASTARSAAELAKAEALAQQEGWVFTWQRLAPGDRDFDREYDGMVDAVRRKMDSGRLVLMEVDVRVGGRTLRYGGPYLVETLADMRMTEADIAVDLAWEEGLMK